MWEWAAGFHPQCPSPIVLHKYYISTTLLKHYKYYTTSTTTSPIHRAHLRDHQCSQPSPADQGCSGKRKLALKLKNLTSFVDVDMELTQKQLGLIGCSVNFFVFLIVKKITSNDCCVTGPGIQHLPEYPPPLLYPRAGVINRQYLL